ncbi:bifunctional diguanylate cyclase/phosphodiesterase [Streptomyces sp. NP160]|uniref:putative bifunctional diguanylate cyclase/phosphodiesterase n=1 Tax=Streptomyces sp. NP160 TaxID=2586637 RepID=UPI00111B54C8|nr:bifunctional diguanylate cyclase/phosphodiesterase [Streptomyces sp. NP160]TNM70204.1 bifunctional diguanylate cyclase/phosphodiesterase [Streptomyces sp. NP160]
MSRRTPFPGGYPGAPRPADEAPAGGGHPAPSRLRSMTRSVPAPRRPALAAAVEGLRWKPRQRSVVTARPAVAWLSGSLFIATGLAVILSTYMPSASAERDVLVVRVVNWIAVLSGIGMILLRGRSTRLLPHITTAGGVLLITTALLSSGGGASAVAYAAVYCLAPGYAFMLLPPRSAAAHLVVTIAIGAPALSLESGVGVAEQVVVWAVASLLGAVVGWMAHALQRAEEDQLTSLANRRGLERALYEGIASSGSSRSLTYALIDIDHFKAWNDVHGRAAGDRLLQEAAQAWASVLPEHVTLGRLGADEFGLVMPQTTSARAAEVVARLHAALPVGVTCSAGLAQHEPGESASMLTARAESAVYTAKRDGRARTHEHTGAGPDGREVHEGLLRGEFVVHFQPIVDPRSGATVAAEALVRWRDPQGGLVPPIEFLPDAERSGAIIELGEWVLRTACTAAASWVPQDGQLPYVTVNASGRELQEPTYWRTVRSALADAGLPPERLVLELVESHYDIESLHLVNNLHQIRQLGVRTAMDDFGVGYSSLDRLRRSGVDILKIDKSFTDDICSSDAEAPLVRAILAMAQALGLRVVAEGVETQVQAEWLLANGCHAVQGWYYGRPRAVLQDVPASQERVVSPS